MNDPINHQRESSPRVEELTTRSNRRRLGVLIAVIVIIASFFWYYSSSHKPYVQGASGTPAVSYDSAGVPPDSLHH